MTAALALDEGRPQAAVVALAPIVDPSGLKVVGESWTQTLLLDATARNALRDAGLAWLSSSSGAANSRKGSGSPSATTAADVRHALEMGYRLWWTQRSTTARARRSARRFGPDRSRERLASGLEGG